jgi:hypothetical protein
MNFERLTNIHEIIMLGTDFLKVYVADPLPCVDYGNTPGRDAWATARGEAMARALRGGSIVNWRAHT